MGVLNIIFHNVNLLLYRYIANIDPAWTKKKGTKKKARRKKKKKATKKKPRKKRRIRQSLKTIFLGQPRKLPIFPTLRSPPKEPYTGSFGEKPTKTLKPLSKGPYRVRSVVVRQSTLKAG